ncbi:23S rRNA (guanosine(2251)-2'-O)-methyltransferase RlmB [Thiohalophilus sp.]|uniref:23S rRNA (guanosine(2251)-2'-O)-methyltransferase RlmB n=1 Tax=Thiohalophilus sp. TaxID=3028392 RepID=UPI003974909C
MAEKHLIFGLHAVEAAVKRDSEHIERVYLEQARRDERARQLEGQIRAAGVALERVKRQVLDDLTDGQRHQGVVAEATLPGPGDERQLARLLDELSEPPLLLVLDGVQDPHNLGACLRTADAAGVQAVIAPKDRACGLTSTVRKVASGAAEIVPFIQVTNLARTLRELRERGIWLVGTDLSAESDLYQADLAGPLALIMGAEEKGLRRLTREHCDQLVRLPMVGTVQSLNVSVSTGICLYEARRQRRAS